MSADVRTFGAAGDGRTLDTAAIAKGVASLAAAGGGTLWFPPGTYLTGAIHLRSHITLYLEAGATILGSTDFDDYPDVETRTQGADSIGYSPLIYGRGLEGVSIRGRGTIDGQGAVWWERGFLFKNAKDPKALYNARERRHLSVNRGKGDKFARGSMIQFFGCRNVLIEGVTLRNSPRWTVHPVYCDNVTVDKVTIWNPPDSKNTDGINPDSCTNVRISNCHISTGDDCIAIKSGRDEDGRRVGRPSENIAIVNCTMLAGHGGVVIGSEMSGDVRNVVVSNCVFRGTKRGLRLKSQRGRGGVIENVSLNNILMDAVPIAGIIIDMVYYDRTGGAPQPVDETTPNIRDIHFSQIVGVRMNELFAIDGLAESPVRNLTLSGLRLHGKSLGRIQDVVGLEITDAQLRVDGPEPLRITRVENAELLNLRIERALGPEPLFVLDDVSRIVIAQARWDPAMPAPVQLKGRIHDLTLENRNSRETIAEASFPAAVSLGRDLKIVR